METIIRVDQNFTWRDVCNQYACRMWRWWIDNYGYESSLIANIVIVDSKQSHAVRNRLYNCEYPRHLFIESENTAQQVWRTLDKFDMVQLTTGVKMFTPIDEFVVKFPPQNSNKRATFGGLGCDVEDAVAFAYHKRSDEGVEDRGAFIQQCDVLNQIINGSLYRFVWHDIKNENDIGHVALGTLSDIVAFAEKCDAQVVFHCHPNLYQCTPDVLFHARLRPHRWYMSMTSCGDIDECANRLMIHKTHLQAIYEEFPR